MTRTSTTNRPRPKSTTVLSVALLALVAISPSTLLRPRPLSQGSGGPVAWVELGPDGAAIARFITPDPGCPNIVFSSAAVPMQQRGSPSQDYPLTVCEAGVPPGAGSASIEGAALPVPNPNPRRILVLGDTGCRLKLERRGDSAQACNDPAAWPAEQIATSAAAWEPDLIIDVGDYLYRESPCPPDNSGCAGSAWGYNWAAWNADFFTPEAPLFRSAPWVFLRGDHELCERAGEGWFRFLDPHPLVPGCQDYTDPFAISAGEMTLLVLDSANADDYQAIPTEVEAYSRQFDALNALAQPGSWLLTHRPVWIFGHAGERDGSEQLFRDNPTLQAATQNELPEGIGLVLSGHIHLYESLAFAGSRPAQLVVGIGGTALDPDITTPLTGLQIADATVQQGVVVDRFGYMTMERAGDGWSATVRAVDGSPLLACQFASATIDCSPAGMP